MASAPTGSHPLHIRSLTHSSTSSQSQPVIQPTSTNNNNNNSFSSFDSYPPSYPHPPNPGSHAAYVLLAEFNIDTGSGLKHQYPKPTGTPEHVLADLMLPDGAHDRNEDWTVFFLNQPPIIKHHPEINKSTLDISQAHSNPSRSGHSRSESLLSADSRSRSQSASPQPDKLLYVISLVRTKKDTSVRRGAICKAMAVCSYHPYIQIFKPILLLALEDYFVNPSIDILAQLFHAINTMDTSGLPNLSYHERMILRCSERQDMFEEKFDKPTTRDSVEPSTPLALSGSNSALSLLGTPPLPSTATTPKPPVTESTPHTPLMASSSFMSFDHKSTHTSHERSSTGSFSNYSPDGSPGKAGPLRSHNRTTSNLAHSSALPSASLSGYPSGTSRKRPRDTHFYDTKIDYAGKSIPVRIPLQTFPEEVGEYSLIQLIQTFSSPNALNPNGPFHPHLHSSGAFTHPIILLFNALVTQKRIVFLGHGLPAGNVSQMVLAACALGSGCGGVLEGFTARAFPYSNLTIYEDFKAVPGYIAGVTNPIFELHTEAWDVFCNIETGRITVSKDIPMPMNASGRPFSPAPPERTMTELTTGSGGIIGIGNLAGSTKVGSGGEEKGGGGGGVKVDVLRDSLDNGLMEDLLQAIQAHFGEPIIRARFMDYVRRFVRIASRLEEDQLGTSVIGFKTKAFTVPQSYLNTNTLEEKSLMLGAGAVFVDEQSWKREIGMNAARIEGWRETESYRRLKKKYAAGKQTHFDFDISHQINRLRISRKMPEVEVQAIYEVLVGKVESYEQIIEVLAHLAPHQGGLLPLGFGLLHPSKRIRALAVDLIRRFEAHETGQKFFQGLNAFHKLAYQRLAHYCYKRASAGGVSGSSGGVGGLRREGSVKGSLKTGGNFDTNGGGGGSGKNDDEAFVEF